MTKYIRSNFNLHKLLFDFRTTSNITQIQWKSTALISLRYPIRPNSIKFNITLVDIKLLRVLKARYATGVLEQKLAVLRIRVDYLTTECIQVLAFLEGSPKVILLQVNFSGLSNQTIVMQFLQLYVLNYMAWILLFRTY